MSTPVRKYLNYKVLTDSNLHQQSTKRSGVDTQTLRVILHLGHLEVSFLPLNYLTLYLNITTRDCGIGSYHTKILFKCCLFRQDQACLFLLSWDVCCTFAYYGTNPSSFKCFSLSTKLRAWLCFLGGYHETAEFLQTWCACKVKMKKKKEKTKGWRNESQVEGNRSWMDHLVLLTPKVWDPPVLQNLFSVMFSCIYSFLPILPLTTSSTPLA